ncbi:MAG: geranylgeranylglycerol-phosphate geranylgeranyltransferase [Bacteroidetes bacterium]|nr:geranylgeranylglycerol-phosphate geranylgeranyltransferase [Bacteroidota bacterium]
MKIHLPFYLLLTRPLNLAIIACTQLIFIFHSAGYEMDNIRWAESLFVILATILTAAAGNVINDIFDIEEDMINNPEKRIISRKISVRNGKIFYGFLIAASLIFGFISGITMGFLCVAIGIMLYFYSSDLKGETLWGNLLIAFMTGAVVFTADLGVYTRIDGYFAEYSLFAFLITLAREIIKDIEDMEGDKQQEYATFPIVYGVRKSAVLVSVILLVMVSLVVYIAIRHGNLPYNIFISLFIILPVIVFLFLLKKAESKKDFHRLSVFLKSLMVTGILSVLGL